VVAGYHIDDQVLLDVLRALDHGGTSVSAGVADLRGAVAARLGTPALDAAAGDLLAGWTATLTDLSAAVATTSTGVRRCHAEYVDTEARIVGLLRDSGGPT
jgi:hypothetical protein